MDDYVQQQIRKPPAIKTCTVSLSFTTNYSGDFVNLLFKIFVEIGIFLACLQYATGWFSSAMLDNLRQRITIRFLSVYPKPVVERLLREATDNFEKSKRRLNKDHVMHSEEEQEEVDTGYKTFISDSVFNEKLLSL